MRAPLPTLAQHGPDAALGPAPLPAGERVGGGAAGWVQGREGPLTRLHPAQGFDKVELLQCIRRLVEVDKAWVPDSSGTSLYVRPVLIGNEVGWLPGLGVGWGATLGGGVHS